MYYACWQSPHLCVLYLSQWIKEISWLATSYWGNIEILLEKYFHPVVEGLVSKFLSFLPTFAWWKSWKRKIRSVNGGIWIRLKTRYFFFLDSWALIFSCPLLSVFSEAILVYCIDHFLGYLLSHGRLYRWTENSFPFF